MNPNSLGITPLRPLMGKLFVENKLKGGKYFPARFLSEKKLKVHEGLTHGQLDIDISRSSVCLSGN